MSYFLSSLPSGRALLSGSLHAPTWMQRWGAQSGKGGTYARR